MNGGTTGGAGGSTVTVSSLSALKSAASGDAKTIIIIAGKITGNSVVEVGSNKSILGKDSNAALQGVGLQVLKNKNVIIRNLKISKVLATAGDAIGLEMAKNVWIDHVDLSSDLDHGKDYYDGLLDITHACDWITVSYSHFHDHYKSSLIGHSDDNGAQDEGHLTVTFTHNYFGNLNSRLPSYRFGTGHIYNNYYENNSDGINSRDGARLLVQNNVFSGIKKPLYSTLDGLANSSGNDFGGGTDTAATCSVTVPYTYSLTSTSTVASNVKANAGAKLTF